MGRRGHLVGFLGRSPSSAWVSSRVPGVPKQSGAGPKLLSLWASFRRKRHSGTPCEVPELVLKAQLGADKRQGTKAQLDLGWGRSGAASS